MSIIAYPTLAIGNVATLELTTLIEKFPGGCFGADIDDVLVEKGYARVAQASDYTFDPATQQLVPLSPATYDADAKLIRTLQVTALAAPALLANAKAAKMGALDARYDALIAAGFNSGGYYYPLDADTLFDMNTVRLEMVAGVPGASTGGWDSVAFQFVAMDDASLSAFLNSVFAYMKSANQNYAAIKRTVMSAADASTVNAIDVTQGWPSN